MSPELKFDLDLKRLIAANLARFDPVEQPLDGLVHAAVASKARPPTWYASFPIFFYFRRRSTRY